MQEKTHIIPLAKFRWLNVIASSFRFILCIPICLKVFRYGVAHIYGDQPTASKSE